MIFSPEPIPTILKERVILQESMPFKTELYPINYPVHRPRELRHRVTYVTTPGFNIRFRGADWLDRCDVSNFSILALIIHDFYGNNTAIDLCGPITKRKSTGKTETFQYESIYHTLTLEYVHYEETWFAPLGNIEQRKGTLSRHSISTCKLEQKTLTYTCIILIECKLKPS